MSESILRAILEESVRHEWDKYDNVPEHIFSKKHERSMNRIFKLFEKNKCKFESHLISIPTHNFRFTKKTVLVLVTILFLAALAGCAVMYFVSNSFRGKVNNDNTELFVINTENCPSTIEDIYYLPDLSDDFEVLTTNSTPFSEYISYQNKVTGQTFSFTQWVKAEFGSSHYNTEGQDFEEIDINGHYGLCLYFDLQSYIYAGVVWDIGDYILELSGDLTKNELIDLAKTAKVSDD